MVQVIKQPLDYIHNPLLVYQNLCEGKPHNLLLESADIESKDQLKSMIMLEAAVKFECRGDFVDIVALAEDGVMALQVLEQHLAADFDCCEKTLHHLRYKVKDHRLDMSEDARLKMPNAFSILRTVFDREIFDTNDEHPFALFLAGGFGFDMVLQTEHFPQQKTGNNHFADYVFYLSKCLLLVDHVQKTTKMLYVNFDQAKIMDLEQKTKRYAQIITKTQTHVAADLTSAKSISHDDYVVNMSDETYAENIRQLKQHIVDGDIFQVVPSRCFSLPCDNPLLAYQYLKQTNPSPYMFFMQGEDFAIFGASPESALKYDAEKRQVELYPIAGTRPRGNTPDLDSRIELDLRSDRKEISEHLMLVDLARNDIARICKAGTRYVKDFLKVDRYSHVMHLVSRVIGTLRDDLDAFHAYQACLNMGTLTGAPKRKAAELIYAIEGQRRGSYGGAIGYFAGDGSMDSCIVIRSAFVTDGTAYIQAGAGIVYDSDPMEEAAESRQKAMAVLSSVYAAQEAS